jgi:hypothetical protein
MLLEFITPDAFVGSLKGTLGSLKGIITRRIIKIRIPEPRILKRPRIKLLSEILEDDNISNVLDGGIEGCDVFEFG